MTESGPTKMSSSSWRDKLFQVVPNAKSWVEAANWVKQQIYFMKEMRVDEKKRREWVSEEMKKSKKEEEEIRVKMKKKKKKWESKNEEEEGRSEREEESVGNHRIASQSEEGASCNASSVSDWKTHSDSRFLSANGWKAWVDQRLLHKLQDAVPSAPPSQTEDAIPPASSVCIISTKTFEIIYWWQLII